MFDPVSIFAHNPGPTTGQGNHTYLLRAPGASALLIDAGVGRAEYLADLARALDGATLRQVAVTHAHPDHMSGSAAIARAHPTTRFLKFPWNERDVAAGVDWLPLRDGDRITASDVDDENTVLVALHTPGHSPDHLAFWHEASRTAFTGDLVTLNSSVMIQASAGGNLSQYLHSLRRVLALHPRRLLPAHGPRIDDAEAVLTRYIEHRLARERQVLQAMASGMDTVESIAESIYHDLDPALRPAAEDTVRAHLDKLQQEHRVVQLDSRWRI